MTQSQLWQTAAWYVLAEDLLRNICCVSISCERQHYDDTIALQQSEAQVLCPPHAPSSVMHVDMNMTRGI